MSSDLVIELHNVWKKYSKLQVLNNSLREELVALFSPRKQVTELHDSEFWALQDVTLTVQRGECIGLYGPNGSGKSTLFKMISKITYPTNGTVKVQGRVAPLIELGAGMHPDLTGMENIYMNGTILGLTIRELKQKSAEIVEFSGLDDFINSPVKKYSSGMYLRLAFSVAVHSNADIFLFDEILTVGDVDFQQKCYNKVRALKSEGKTIILISHDMEYLKQFADRICLIKKGVVAK
jgi:ABC-type polysaccharide/polyol phosphate transport system ATPase subunit